MRTLLVFSHLRWDFVYQRPQHLLSRLATHWNVVVVEEPVQGSHRLEASRPCPGVTVLRPHTLATGHGFDGEQIAAVGTLLRSYLADQGIDDYGVWFYTPMAVPLLAGLRPEVIIYDCMDELSAFRNAPPRLLAREQRLLQLADVVFTGGPSLFDAKRDRHPHVHCMPSSVDAEHFMQGAHDSNADPIFDPVRHPRLGFYGVIDERLDLDLVAALADTDAHWQICIVGPVVKIDESSLPRRANLHYFQQQDYESLPGILAAWDVCLLPFALNEATRYISPTKTLEYMCAGKPVVSTAITDVGRLYGPGVSFAHDHNAFITACRAALAEDAASRQDRMERQRALVAGTSWDTTAAQMAELIVSLAEQRADESVQSASPPVISVPPVASPPTSLRWARRTRASGA